MKTKHLHKWDLTYRQARDLQIRLARRVRFTPLKAKPRIVAGLDCAFSKDGKRIFAAVVVIKMPGLTVIETTTATKKVNFPYIPGLLSFREAPVCIDALEKLKCKPDVLIVDGQGIAHPRRFGIGCHIGVLVNIPSVGCAKSRLIGSFNEPARSRGNFSPLVDGNEVIGAVLRTRVAVKPVFVSVGHKCTLEDAIKIVLDCSPKYRLPEPSRLAHQLVGRVKT
ncbi:MAG: deoxyribonuclease V [Sedimentisphaerales bacterium]|nr:deoxyribonuclease V [Sedimentisphaerales bacterium]